ncbi:MAG: DUF2142 domain-containing protein [Xanthobacteraceae bacterium]
MAGRIAARSPLVRQPVAVFVLVATLFGFAAVFAIPPLRGADEPAHFLRAYGIAHGQVVPSLQDAQGRKGIFLPARLHDDYQFFETVRYRFGTADFNYRRVFADFLRRNNGPDERPPVFVLYAGSEGYAPMAYLPYVAGALIGRLIGLDFVPMLLLMRLLGLAATTALAAYAIAIVPYFKWTFLFIAMLPIALFERAIVCADGAALSLGLVVTALCLRAACGGGVAEPPWQRALWMTLCVVIKPSQIVFVVLEGMTRPFKELPRAWRSLGVIIPGVALTVAWLMVGSADMAAWRMVEGTGEPAEHFNIGWKLRFLLAQPQHFVNAALGSLGNLYELWREVIGGLGWRDTHLPLALYILLSATFVVTCLVRLDCNVSIRRRIAVFSWLAVLGYWAVIFLIFYLAWTPLDTQWIHGIQGRYFTIILPPAAVALAATLNCGLREGITATIAVAGAVLSGIAMIDAVIRSQW